MTIQEMLLEIKHLSFQERLELLESITRSLREELRSVHPGESSLARVRGLLKLDGPLPSDKEMADAYGEHLMEKYT